MGGPERTLSALSQGPSQSDQALEVLTEAIVSGQLVSGALYSVQGLSHQLGVSRTPVREALLQLQLQGLVKFERNRGARIIPISVHAIDEIYQIRLWLEVPSTIEATNRMTSADRRTLRRLYRAMTAAAKVGDAHGLWRNDRAFHELIMSAAGNTRLVEYIGVLRDLLVTRRTTTVDGSSRSPSDVALAHRPILDAFEAHDAEAAGEAMRAHLAYTRQLLLHEERETLSRDPK
jgi:DNA-binding GntR family transcriptional regulator